MDALTLTEKVDLFTMKYCNDLLTHHFNGKNYRLDPNSLIPKFHDKKDVADKMTDLSREYFTAEGRQAAKVRKEMERPAYDKNQSKQISLSTVKNMFGNKASEGASTPNPKPQAAPNTPAKDAKAQFEETLNRLDKFGDNVEKKFEKIFGVAQPELEIVDPLECMFPKEKRLSDQSLQMLCMKLKNLDWAKRQTENLELDVVRLWNQELERKGITPPAPPPPPAEKENEDEEDQEPAPEPVVDENSLGELFTNSQMAVDHGREQLADYIANKVVFFDMRDDFVAKLYYPNPKSNSLSPLLAQDSAMDTLLTAIAAEFAIEDFSHLMWFIFEKVMVRILKALEWCLIGEAMGAIRRHFSHTDVSVIKEDLVVLQDYFIQRDEEGNANGLDENLVLEHSARIEGITTKLLAVPTQKLMEMYYERDTLEDDPTEIVTRKNILGALARRSEKEAKDLVKEVKKKKK